MLFNSYVFIFAFFPLTVAAVWFAHARFGRRPALAVLTLASLVFYTWWEPVYVLLPIGSLLFNFAIGPRVDPGAPARRAWLTLGIAANVGLLCWFKYAAFVATNVEALTGLELGIRRVLLPLALSFTTFEQIAYLVDRYRGQIGKHDFLLYSVYLTFFPHFIAGPIIRFHDIAGQLLSRSSLSPRWDTAAAGTAIFVIGLFKKVVIADSFAPHAQAIFGLAEAGHPIPFVAAWSGALSYTFQLYFDFSGYSEMALGLALFFGIRLPVNFFSPYKATSIIDFWRRWHITLSRFLRDYLYIPLGGNRRGEPRRYLNVIVTMALAGLWHGAGWTFIAWGTLHGAMLVANHGWRALRAPPMPPLVGGIVTFLAVVCAWVFFRADSFAGAGHLLRAMAGADGFLLPAQIAPYLPALSSLAQFSTPSQHWLGPLPTEVVPLLAVVAAIVFVAPNVPQLFLGYVDAPADVAAQRPRPALTWRFQPMHAAALGVAAFWSLALLAQPQEFLYFNF